MLKLRFNPVAYATLALGVGITQFAVAGPKTSVFAVGDWAKQTYTNNGDFTSKSKLGIGGGASFEFHFYKAVGLEIGALYFNRKLNTTLSSVTTTSAIPTLQIPVIFRMGFLPFLSIGVGGYAARAMGDVNVTDSSGNVSKSPLGNQNIKTMDFGLVGSVRIGSMISSSIYLFLDGRYNMSLTNNSSTVGSTLKYGDMQALLGLTFGSGKSN